jgi:hypothetical protein
MSISLISTSPSSIFPPPPYAKIPRRGASFRSTDRSTILGALQRRRQAAHRPHEDGRTFWAPLARSAGLKPQ